MHVSAFTPRQCSFVTHLGMYASVFIHMRVLTPDACGTTRPRQRTQTCAECHGARVQSEFVRYIYYIFAEGKANL